MRNTTAAAGDRAVSAEHGRVATTDTFTSHDPAELLGAARA